MLTKVELKNGNVYLVMTEGKNPCYKKLAEALIDRLTAAQLVKYTIQTPKGKLVRFMDLVECFDLHDGEQNDQKCICGASIHNGRIVQNVDDGFCHVIGSTCKDNWVEMNIANDSHHCKYCLRANQTGDHIACKGKQSFQEIATELFRILKAKVGENTYAKGIYKNKPITIRKLVATNWKYCRWLVEESQIEDALKLKISNAMTAFKEQRFRR